MQLNHLRPKFLPSKQWSTPVLLCLLSLPLLFLSCAREEKPAVRYTQEIEYLVRDASEVYLVWGINGWQIDAEAERSERTIVREYLLYTLMEASQDTFRASINVPEGATVNFLFWISKSKGGHLRDTWDQNGLSGRGYEITARDQGPVRFSANLLPAERWPAGSVIGYGWIVCLLLALAVAGGKIFRRSPAAHHGRPGYNQKVMLTGLSMYLFHWPLRMDILGAGGAFFFVEKLVSGADDLIYLAILVLLFISLGASMKKHLSEKSLFTAFRWVCFFSLVAAQLNTGIVEHLGRPLNYHWLYYSDFLGNTEARSAILANFSWITALNILAYGSAAILLSVLLTGLAAAFRDHRRFHAVLFGGIGLLVSATLGLKMLRLPNLEGVDQGKLEHPVSSFFRSILAAEPNSTLFTLEVPDSLQYAPASPGPAPKAGGGVKNIVLVVLESAGATYFDRYGGTHHLTPVLNRYADQSALFEHLYAHAPASNKSLVSLLCSIYPWISYQTLTQERPDFKHHSLSDELKEKGYRTAFFASGDFAFQRSDEFLKRRSFDTVEDKDQIPCALRFRLSGGSKGDGYSSGIDDSCLIPRFTDWLDAADTIAPFFSMLWTIQGHYPYFLSSEERDFAVGNLYLNKYLNALQQYDAVIGQLIDSLRTRNLFDSTLIAIVGDHGEAFGQHQQYGHGAQVYEENLRVPFILINPVLFSGERISTMGGLADVAPTLISLTGRPVPDTWQGTDLLTADPARPVFFFASWSDYLFGIRIGDYKAIFDETSKQAELYDLSTDPSETRNLAAQHPGRMEEYRLRVAAWVQYQDQFIRDLLSE